MIEYFGTFMLGLSFAASQAVGVQHFEVLFPNTPREPEPQEHSTLFLGDVMLDRYVETKMLQGNNPFKYVSETVNSFDIAVANLEGPITLQNNCVAKQYSFQFQPTVAPLLKSAGIDVLSLANNHTYDCYKNGYYDTHFYLSQNGLHAVDRENVFRYNTSRGQVSLIGVDRTLSMYNELYVNEIISREAGLSSYVIVFVHWGDEYESTPSRAQVQQARSYIDSGAFAVIGHHPHVIQPAERYKDGYIFYSLGNFIFDQLTNETNEGYAIALKFNNLEGVEITVMPYSINDTNPAFFDEDSKDKSLICERVFDGFEREEQCTILHSSR